MTKKKEANFILGSIGFWNEDKTIWTQPPVDIKHGDLVELEYGSGTQTVIGRYIGKGYGVAKFHNYATGDRFEVTKVVHRGYNLNPLLVTNEELFNFIKD